MKKNNHNHKNLPYENDDGQSPLLRPEDIGVDIRHIGAVSLAKAMFENMGINDVIGKHCKPDLKNHLTHGQVIEMLAVNLLISPEAMYRVSDWAGKAGIKDAYGIEPEWLNDDRISRALDAVHPYLNEIKSEVAINVSEKFDIPLKFLHWDLTHFTFAGEYDDQSPEFVQIVYSKKKAGDSAEKSVKVGLNISVNDNCAVPLWYDVLNGSESEYKATIQNMDNLKKHLKVDKIVRISDKGCFSAKILSKTTEQGFYLISAESFTPHYRSMYQKSLSSGVKSQEMSYLSQKERDKRERELLYDGYQGFEVNSFIEYESKKYPIRVIFVHSDGKDRRDKKARNKHINKINEIIAKCRKSLGKPHYGNAENSTKMIAKKLDKFKETKNLNWKVEGDGKFQSLCATWDEEALKNDEVFDGIYPLIATIPKKECSTDEVFSHYKEQIYIEQCNKNMKRPLRIRPIYLHKQNRIESLVFVLFMALMAYCLINKTIKKIPKRKDLKHPTVRDIFWIFSNVSFVKIYLQGQCIIKPSILSPLQTYILDLMGVKMNIY